MSGPVPALSAGAVLALVLGGVLTAGLVLERWSLVALSGWAMGSALLLVLLDIWRRVRSLRRYVRDQVRAAIPEGQLEMPTAPTAPVMATPEDVVGAVRILQAQYVGRLDRMQTSLDETMALLQDRTSTPTG